MERIYSYKGKDLLTGFYVYGPVYKDETGKIYIDDIEAGLVPVDPNTVCVDNGNELPDPKRIFRTASDFDKGDIE